ncbi:MAG: hypoxanthine-guanine phosphoribosyltransferase [Thermomonas sp.]|uniref:hypoxanthine-guanine phosphoribosyltransferase n=1 Tax=Thermomonas sp. TaxID=1971895 RepID=UPI001ED4EFC6|nr:hypoxanthine-guanine phosphoribosyltransferase [Thermomonas sp.]MBV2208951.1 hypoxanthine-guanine phosphoribosyltransferase [Thermomonas sp.]
MTMPKLKDALPSSHVLFERDVLETEIMRMADEICAAYAEDEVPLFITVMNGGLPFAAQLGFALGERGLDLQYDYLHATRYRGQTTGSGLAWLHRPATPMAGRKVLLVDDILDEGHTLLAVKQWCEDQGAAEVRIAVLAEKVHDRCVDGIQAQHVGVQVPDAFVFGYGMDYYEQGRNLPAIYALAD